MRKDYSKQFRDARLARKRKTYQFNPNWCMHPGSTIREYLEVKKMTQRELAQRLDRPPEQVNRLVNGRIDITAQWAIGLEKVFGRPAEFWMSMNSNYQLGKARGLKVVK